MSGGNFLPRIRSLSDISKKTWPKPGTYGYVLEQGMTELVESGYKKLPLMEIRVGDLALRRWPHEAWSV